MKKFCKKSFVQIFSNEIFALLNFVSSKSYCYFNGDANYF